MPMLLSLSGTRTVSYLSVCLAHSRHYCKANFLTSKHVHRGYSYPKSFPSLPDPPSSHFFYATVGSRPFRGQGKHLCLLFYPFQPQQGLNPTPRQPWSVSGGQRRARAMGSQPPLGAPRCLAHSKCLEIICRIELAVGGAQPNF